MKRLVLISFALISMLAFAACSSPTKKAERVTMDFFKALNAGDYDKARTYTASEQAEAYVNLMSYFDSDSVKVFSQEETPERTTKIASSEERQDTVICYVETTEQPTNPTDSADVFKQKVVLTKVDNEWKIVDIPMK
ncbi:hypothetical protein HMPREF9294_0462 [Porphyromonas asaccharolytica PR426713P-I]|uniref:DUF4878 domain-containing protein n=1 Tax=Porphyromonas asaccharolytica TaxID=28123 RepID=UPI0001EB159B|nr:DUF4878 domain-containing protein [Porphyromonas asaccharolytica]EFR34909.1 hypothetical protein HMPREF9294_0462 [Porphyromonas asaccharolytica PR426713P-I]